jgi:DnaK suppressor protein
MQKIEDKFLTKVRMRLEEEQAGKLRKAEVLTRCRSTTECVPEPPGGDEADMAVVSIEERLEHLELCRISSSVRSIEAALLTIELGRYGDCLRCNQPIPSRRLKALPAAILCRQCQEAAEAGREERAWCRA